MCVLDHDNCRNLFTVLRHSVCVSRSSVCCLALALHLRLPWDANGLPSFITYVAEAIRLVYKLIFSDICLIPLESTNFAIWQNACTICIEAVMACQRWLSNGLSLPINGNSSQMCSQTHTHTHKAKRNFSHKTLYYEDHSKSRVFCLPFISQR